MSGVSRMADIVDDGREGAVAVKYDWDMEVKDPEGGREVGATADTTQALMWTLLEYMAGANDISTSDLSTEVILSFS